MCFFFNSLSDVSDTPTKQAKIDKKILKNSNIFLKNYYFIFYFLFSVFAFMLLKPSRYWKRISQTTQKGEHVLISLPVSANLTKQKPVDNNSNKKAKLTFEFLHFYCK